MQSTVVVVGGGYGGIAAAKALDDVADVVLVEARDRFVHNVAALRGLVDPQWTDQLFLPYDRLLEHGMVVRDRAVHVDTGGVTLRSGQHLPADYIVLATGSGYPFPAKVDVDDSSTAKGKIHVTREALEQAGSVLLLGAGPVGLELAGEIRAAAPDKHITVVDPADDVLSGGFTAELREELRRQLNELGIELLLGTSLLEQPPSEPGTAKTFTAATSSGHEVTADVWFRCFGVSPTSDYLAGELAGARQAGGQVEVTPALRLPGQRHVFAIGDITAVPEAKMAKYAGEHAEVAAANIRALITGGGELTHYEPSAPGIALPLGPAGGASYAEGMGFFGPAETAEMKGADLFVDRFAELLGLR